MNDYHIDFIKKQQEFFLINRAYFFDIVDYNLDPEIYVGFDEQTGFVKGIELNKNYLLNPGKFEYVITKLEDDEYQTEYIEPKAINKSIKSKVPETYFYRQLLRDWPFTNKILGLSDGQGSFLRGFITAVNVFEKKHNHLYLKLQTINQKDPFIKSVEEKTDKLLENYKTIYTKEYRDYLISEHISKLANKEQIERLYSNKEITFQIELDIDKILE